MMLLDITSQEITFSLWNLGMMIGGVLSLAGVWFWMKYKVIALVKDNKNMKEQYEKSEKVLHDRIDKLGKVVNDHNDKVFEKMDEMRKEVEAKIDGMKTDVLSAISNLKMSS